MTYLELEHEVKPVLGGLDSVAPFITVIEQCRSQTKTAVFHPPWLVVLLQDHVTKTQFEQVL